jgi:hypothetical protein
MVVVAIPPPKKYPSSVQERHDPERTHLRRVATVRKPEYAASTGLATQLAEGIYKYAAPLELATPSPYVKEHARCIPRPATVNVASIGHPTTGMVKLIVSHYRNRYSS